MSMPEFPSVDPDMTPEDSLNMILSSIAMEELGLSHIINVEGEKLQYILGTNKPSVREVLAVNKSVKALLDTILQNQMLLKSKMECALGALKRKRRCPSGQCCAAAFQGCRDQCLATGKTLQWQPSRSECRSIRLSDDGRRIILKPGCRFTVSFILDLSAEADVAIALRTSDAGNAFVYHAPVVCKNKPFTISAAGIFVSACNSDTELALALLTPCSAKVKQSGICVMEV